MQLRRRRLSWPRGDPDLVQEVGAPGVEVVQAVEEAGEACCAPLMSVYSQEPESAVRRVVIKQPESESSTRQQHRQTKTLSIWVKSQPVK